MNTALTKHQQNSAKTREKLIDAALELYGSRSIDAVSLREISVAAGQKNPNALQYHFHNREGLLQAIIDKHATRIGALRDAYLKRAEDGEWQAAEAAARCLLMPIIDYVDANPEGLYFVNIVSQICAFHQNGLGNTLEDPIRFPRPMALVNLFERAVVSIPAEEAQRRIYLAVTIAFHSISDIYRANDRQVPGSAVADRGLMLEQLIGLLQSFFSMPSTQH